MKRSSTDEPLTADDVAERLNKAMLRTWRILMDVRQTEGLYEDVRRSRYLAVQPQQLIEELQHWVDYPTSDPDRPGPESLVPQNLADLLIEDDPEEPPDPVSSSATD